MKRRKNTLRCLRIIFELLMFLGITFMLCDWTGTLHRYLSWMAKIQFLPALLAIGKGVGLVGLIIVLVILIITWLFGRVYCSIICPMGALQDGFSRIGGAKFWRHITKRLGHNRFSPIRDDEKSIRNKSIRKTIRVVTLVLFVVLFAVPSSHWIATLIAPYSAYGRISQSLLAPIGMWINNLLAKVAEHYDSYAFYTTDVWIKSISTLVVAIVTLVVIGVLSFFKGRVWCETICPVGTTLGLISKHALFRPTIDEELCNGCQKCARNCKAECIDVQHHVVDMARCVGCMDCISNCNQGAIDLKKNLIKGKTEDKPDSQRRKFIGLLGTITLGGVVSAQHKTTDGGLAIIEDKKVPQRATPLKPAGSVSIKHFSDHCTGCQLCVSACPNKVLRPSGEWSSLMQPEMEFERGYCPVDCTKCSDVCPTGAIIKIEPADKTAIQVGHAVWVKENCVVITDDVACGNCARKCPTGAILMVPMEDGREVPSIDTEKCIGCGKCEYLCPSRPFSAIYVEGHDVHRSI